MTGVQTCALPISKNPPTPLYRCERSTRTTSSPARARSSRSICGTIRGISLPATPASNQPMAPCLEPIPAPSQYRAWSSGNRFALKPPSAPQLHKRRTASSKASINRLNKSVSCRRCKSASAYLEDERRAIELAFRQLPPLQVRLRIASRFQSLPNPRSRLRSTSRILPRRPSANAVTMTAPATPQAIATLIRSDRPPAPPPIPAGP